jgi:hypothetical protein
MRAKEPMWPEEYKSLCFSGNLMFLSSPRNVSLIFLCQSKNITDEHKIFLKKIHILSASPSEEPPKQAYIYFRIHKQVMTLHKYNNPISHIIK